MEDWITHKLNKWYKKNRFAYTLAFYAGIVFLVGVIALIIWGLCRDMDSVWGSVVSDMLATVVGIIVAFVMLRIGFLLGHRNEDKNKVSYSNADMWKQYGTNYRQQFALNGPNVCTVYCEKMFLKEPDTVISVDDYPDEFFELDSFIKSQFFTLIEAHAMSDSTNSITVRLKEVLHPSGSNLVVIRTMRSTYLSHMLTNRALDYELKPGITIRSLFENTDRLIPPQRSRMSNHLGVNALVFLKEGNDKRGWLLLPERGGNATVAKNKVTASIATRIKMKDYTRKLETDFIVKGCIESSIAGSIHVTKLPEMDIQFLGLSRDIYEGGKPTLFYVVYLDMDKDTYIARRNEYETANLKSRRQRQQEQRKGFLPAEEEIIDEVTKIHIAQWTSVKMGEPCAKELEQNPAYYNTAFDNAKLTFKADGKKEEKAFEQNLIANFWFLLGCPNEVK